MKMLGSHTLIRINPKEKAMILQIKDAWFRLLEHYGSKIGNYGWRKRWINRQVGTGYLNSKSIT